MIRLYGVNPFAEALVYYWGRANGLTVSERLSRALKLYPAQRELLEGAAAPALALQKRLDEKLRVDDEPLNRFFKALGNWRENAPFGFCLASVLTYFPLLDHIEYSADELFGFLRSCCERERMYGLCFGLIGNCETLFHGDDGRVEYSRKVEKLQIPFESKWRLTNAAFNYAQHIDELESLIKPAAELIAAAHAEYDAAVAEFRSRYDAENALELIETHFGQKLESVDIMKIAPLILGFDGKCAVTETDDGSAPADGDPSPDSPFMGRMLLGVSQYIIGSSPHNAYAALSDKLKTLSDSTRLEILFYLCSHRAYGQELCDKFSLQRPALSYHVSKLLAAGFVTSELSGGKTYYSADRGGIERMLEAFRVRLE